MSNELREEHAKRLLEDPLFQEAFETLRQELLARWENSTTHEVDARESIWLGLALLKRIHAHIESIVTTGEIAKIMEKQSPFI